MVNVIENVNLRVQIGEAIDRRWKVTKILGEGAFGAVYEVEDVNTGKPFALKLEQNNLHDPSQNMLKLEVTVLRFLRNSGAKCCPGYESCGQNEKFNYVVMGLVGQNISSLKKKLPFKRFTLRSCLHIGIVSCRGIEEIHNIGFVHRDLKPANMAVGRPPNYRHVYVLDWGLCRRFVNEQGRMIPARRKAPYRGTPRYSSPNALAEKEQGRVDDMWSWLFSLIDLTVGKLPWDDGGPSKTNEWFEWLAVEKKTFVADTNVLLKGCPKEYNLIYAMLTSMGFGDRPEYTKLMGVCDQVMRRKKYERSTPLDWEPESDNHHRTSSVPFATLINGE